MKFIYYTKINTCDGFEFEAENWEEAENYVKKDIQNERQNGNKYFAKSGYDIYPNED